MQKAAELLTKITKIKFDAKQTESMLNLYPKARIELATNGLLDTSVRNALSVAVAHFFLGCSWPTYGDNIDIETFTGVLKRQAVKAGYTEAMTTKEQQ